MLDLLLIWQEIPDRTMTYKFEKGSLKQKEYDLLVACHNHIFGLGLESPPELDKRDEEVYSILSRKKKHQRVMGGVVIGGGIPFDGLVVISGFVI